MFKAPHTTSLLSKYNYKYSQPIYMCNKSTTNLLGKPFPKGMLNTPCANPWNINHIPHNDNTICKPTSIYILNLQAPLQGLGGWKHTRGNFGKKMYSNFCIFVFFQKQFFFHFIQCFEKHSKWILDIRLITQSCSLSKESVFIHFFHTLMFI